MNAFGANALKLRAGRHEPAAAPLSIGAAGHSNWCQWRWLKAALAPQRASERASEIEMLEFGALVRDF